MPSTSPVYAPLPSLPSEPVIIEPALRFESLTPRKLDPPPKIESQKLDIGSTQAAIEGRRYSVGIVYLVLVMVGFGINIRNIVIYANVAQTTTVTAFLGQNYMALAFGGLGFGLYVALNRGVGYRAYTAGVVLFFVIGATIPSIAQVLISGLVGLTATVAPADYFLLFLSLAIHEELLFRSFIQTTIWRLMNVLVRNAIVKIIVAVVVTSLIFAIVHTSVYTDIKEIVVVFVCGLCLGISIELAPTDNLRFLDYSLPGHLIINIIAGIQFVQLYYGGF